MAEDSDRRIEIVDADQLALELLVLQAHQNLKAAEFRLSVSKGAEEYRNDMTAFRRGEVHQAKRGYRYACRVYKATTGRDYEG